MDFRALLPAPYFRSYLVCIPVILLAVLLYQYSKTKRKSIIRSNSEDPYEDIHALTSFDWASEPPIRLRPFKPRYHLTMAIENIAFDDLVAVDRTYLDRIKLRRQVMADYAQDTLAALPGSEPLIKELYTWLISAYLPQRFPTMYTLIAPQNASADAKATRPLYLRNLITSESIPATPPSDPLKALHTLSAHIDTDFLFLAPRPASPSLSPSSPSTDAKTQEQKYHLLAFANCFPSGFAPRDKLGLPLDAIHKPVPGYAAKLEKSMDRFFAALPKGRIVRRANWTVTTDPRLFVLKGNHFHGEDGFEHGGGAGAVDREVKASNAGGDEGEETKGTEGDAGGKTLDVNTAGGLWAEVEKQKKDVRVEQCRLRAERQTLHRLPKTGGLVFAFKTYTYGLDEVKAEDGMAEALAEAIEGFGKGSVPDMQVYKRQVVWGEKVCEYLRSA